MPSKSVAALLALLPMLSARAGTDFDPARHFTDGRKYTYRAGTRGFGGGLVALTQKKGVLTFRVPILFLGAGTFSRATLAGVRRDSKPEKAPNPAYFKKGLDSFAEVPELAKSIRALAKSIEDAFATSRVRLEIDVRFGRDSDYLAAGERKETAYAVYLMNLRNGVNAKHAAKGTDAIPISVVAKPDPARASPSEWDVYSDPRLFAHELFHVIGTLFEGYECDVYPPDGFMQEGTMFRALSELAPDRPTRLLNADLLELLSNGFAGAKSFSPAPNDPSGLGRAIETGASSLLCVDHGGAARRDYLSWSADRRRKNAESEIKDWLKGSERYRFFR